MAGGAVWWANNQDSNADLDGGNANLANAHESLREMEARMEKLDKDLAERERQTETLRILTEDLPADVAAMRQELKDMRREVAQLRASKRGRTGTGSDESLVSAGDLEKFIKSQVASQVKKGAKKARRRTFTQFAPMAKMGMQRRLQRNAKKLKLNPEQSRRLNEASNKAFDAAMPNVAVAMDGESTPEEREQALTDIQTEMETVSNDAESYMDSEQFTQFLAMQQEQSDQFQAMQQAFTGGNSSSNPGGVSGGGDAPSGPTRGSASQPN